MAPIFSSPENTVCASGPVFSANMLLNSPGPISVVDIVTVMFGITKGPTPGKPSIVLMLKLPIVPAAKSSPGYNACMRRPSCNIAQRKIQRQQEIETKSKIKIERHRNTENYRDTDRVETEKDRDTRNIYKERER